MLALLLSTCMSLLDEFRSLRRLAEKLPFALDDVGRANDAFVRWRGGEESARVTVDLYAYLYARRYYLSKFITNRNLPPTECDVLVSRAYERIQGNLLTVRKAERFAAWLSVVCVNLFRNYLRRRPKVSNFEDDAAERLEGDALDVSRLDQGAVTTALLAAIVQLPDYLRDVAHMRLIDGLPYEEMSEATGRDVPTMRSYVNKALAKLRADSDLRDLRHGG